MPRQCRQTSKVKSQLQQWFERDMGETLKWGVEVNVFPEIGEEGDLMIELVTASDVMHIVRLEDNGRRLSLHSMVDDDDGEVDGECNEDIWRRILAAIIAFEVRGAQVKAAYPDGRPRSDRFWPKLELF